jgi:CHASE2 domain-containing sensor protein
MSDHQKAPFWKECLHATVWIAVIALGMKFAEARGWLRGLEAAGLDTLVRQQPADTSRHIFIVEITDHDYSGPFFGSKSPLNAESLGQLIARVRSVVGERGVVGVDIDTSDPGFRLLKDKYGLHRHSNIVWARLPTRMPDEPEGGHVALGSLGSVLGESPPHNLPVGVPIFPADPDGAVRKYHRAFSLSQSHEEMVPSLAWAMLQKTQRPQTEAADEERFFNFRGDRTKFPVISAAQFLESFKAEDAARVLEGKLVLIGGTFSAARDVYITSRGRMAGVELIAHALDSDLRGIGIREFSHALALPIDVVLGYLVVAAFHFIPWVRVAFWACLLVMVPATFLASLCVARTSGYWLNFVPLVIGVIIHQLLEQNKTHRHRIKELEGKLKSRAAAT